MLGLMRPEALRFGQGFMQDFILEMVEVLVACHVDDVGDAGDEVGARYGGEAEFGRGTLPRPRFV